MKFSRSLRRTVVGAARVGRAQRVGGAQAGGRRKLKAQSGAPMWTGCWQVGKEIKTGFKLMVTLQSGCVIKILTLCRMNKIFFKKYHEKAKIHSFPTIYNTI